MKALSAVKKVKSHFKKQGIDIEIVSPQKDGRYCWYFSHNGYVASFSPNGHNGYSEGWEDCRVSGFHVRREDDHSDMMSDYFAGSFRDNLTQLLNAVLPSPSKFQAGDLVRGKNNKRATRFGFAGRVGVVKENGTRYSASHVDVMFLGGDPATSAMLVSDRDLELEN